MKICINILFCLLSLRCLAQAPPLDTSCMPMAGDKFYYYKLEGYTPAGPATDTGANIAWDFSGFVMDSFPSDSTIYHSHPQFLNCVTPYSNLVEEPHNTLFCYLKNTTGFYMNDQIDNDTSNGNIPTAFVWPRPVFNIPTMSFRQIVHDTGYNVTYRNAYPFDTFSKGYAYSTYKYDGWGTLKIGSLTFDSVIHVTKTFIRKDSNYHSYRRQALSFYYIYCSWYSPKNHEVILSYIHNNVFVVEDTLTGEKDTTYPRGYPVEFFSDVSLNAASYPPPHSPVLIPQQDNNSLKAFFKNDKLEIRGNNTYGQSHYALYSGSGRLLLEGDADLSGNTEILLPNLDNGIYYLKTRDKQGNSFSTKIFKK